MPDHTGSTFITSHTKKTQPTMTLSSAALSPSLPHKETSLLPTAGLIFHSHTNETRRTIRAGNASYQNFQVIHTKSARSPSPPEEMEDMWRSKTPELCKEGIYEEAVQCILVCRSYNSANNHQKPFTAGNKGGNDGSLSQNRQTSSNCSLDLYCDADCSLQP